MAKKITLPKDLLTEATVFSIRLAKKHPNKSMRINGVKIEGYKAKNYELPAGTDLNSAEVKAWFIIEKALSGKPVTPDDE